MDPERRKAYMEGLRGLITEMEGALEDLASRARRAEAHVRSGLAADEEDLRCRLREAQSRLREMQSASEEGWEEIRLGAERLWRDVRAAWQSSGTHDSEGADPSHPSTSPSPVATEEEATPPHSPEP
jgi:hypothetical protein